MVEKRKDGFYIRLQGLDGTWFYEKVKGATSEKEADARWHERTVQLDRQRKGLEPVTFNPEGWTLKKASMHWLDTHSSKLASHKGNKQTVDARIIADDLAELPLEHVTPGMINRFLNKQTTAPQTVNNLRSFLSRIMQAAIDDEYFLGPNPVGRKVKKRDVADPDPVFLELEEVQAVLAVATPTEHLILMLALHTGMRWGEQCALEWSDIDMDHRVIRVRRSHGRKTTKGGRARSVDISPELFPVLKVAPRTSRYVVPNHRTGKRRTSNNGGLDIIHRVMTRAGLARVITFHVLRDTFASWWLMNGGTLEALQEILGHTSIELTRRRYGHLSRRFITEQWAGFSLKPKPKKRGRPPGRRAAGRG